MPDLLYEIGVEEIPASYIRPALRQLESLLQVELEGARLAHGEIESTGSPRRLVVVARAIAERQPDAVEEVVGPPARAALDAQGNPTKAALGFARSQGVDVSAIQRRDTPKGPYCFVRKQVKGRKAVEILAEILPKITLALSFPKSMVWISGQGMFARPVRSFAALLGTAVVPFELFNVKSGRSVEGHPILSPGRFDLPSADFEEYRRLLRERSVIVDMEERKDLIRQGINRPSQDTKGIGVAPKEAQDRLLDEVTNLVQCPSVVLGHFDTQFLQVPAPAIEAAMMEHQRYFPMVGPEGLRPNFLVVNDRPDDPQGLIRLGNEQVLKARLSDAQFFDQQDRKVRLEERAKGLSGVAFLKGLGTYADKSLRLEKLARNVAEELGLDAVTADHAGRAALFCKADLLTEMVGEFPALQGEVGRIYASRDGEPQAVADAIAEHYMPRSADGALPETPAGRALSLAEKLDNIIGCFALGLVPTGSQDPYALRRQSQAALRIIEESERQVRLSGLLRTALDLLPEPHRRAEQAVQKALDFIRDRLFQLALDRGAPNDLINAVLAAGFGDVVDFWMRLDALRQLSTDSCWQDLVIAVERTHNISRAAPDDGAPDPALLTEPLEKDVWRLFEAHRAEIIRLETERKYEEASRRYTELFAKTLHEFFDKVFVNVDDEKVRNNRLRLLKQVSLLYSARIADLSQIVTGVQK